MAIEEKLFKSLEYLRGTSEYSGDVCQRNKEKIQNCAYVTDTLTNVTTRTLPNFHHLLTTSFEILFQMCNDVESDVRLVAEESLNKIIKAMDNENTNKVLMELHKEIKRNGAARSLKSALWRFSILAGLIRLPKWKQYLISLIPCIVSISERNEDLTHEALMNSLPKILKSLGSFLSDSDVKTLLNTFLNNVGDASTVIRRASANCLLTICINCRKPYQFLSYLLDTLLDLLMPLAGTMLSVFLVVGVLSCLKMLIPHIRKIEGRQEIQGSFGITKKAKVIQVGEEKFVQVYRLCVHFVLCDDDSVTSAALDTLSTLFQNCTREFKNLLLSADGIGLGGGRYPFPTQLYNVNNVMHGALKSTLLENSHKQNDTTISSSLPVESVAEENVESHKKDAMNLIRVRDVKELRRNDEMLNIGSPYDKNVALVFCSRLICRQCLLSGRRTGMIPDSAVRISVKSSALACLASLFAIYPQGFLLYLSKNRPPTDEIDDRQPISDIMLLANHSDPQLRGAIRLVIASYLKSAYLEASTATSYGDWLLSISDTSLSNEFNSNRLLAFIKEGLLDVSSNCVRQSLTGLITCMNYVLLSSDSRLVLPLLEQIPDILQGAHWLVKAKILEVIEQLPFPLIHSLGGEENFRDRLVFDVVFDLLADDDQRVRTIAAKTVVRIVPLLFYSEGRKSAEKVAVEHARMYFHDKSLSKTTGKERDAVEEEQEREGEEKEKEDMSEAEKIHVKMFCDDLPFPFDTLLDAASEEDSNVGDALSTIVSALCRRLATNFASDNTIAGYVEALSLLSASYPTTTYKRIWGVDEPCQMSLLSFVGCLLDNELIYDIDCHTHVLRLYGNLFAGMYVHMLRTKDIDDLTAATPLTPTATATSTAQRLLWRKFGEKRQQEICESFLNHTLKLLNIFVHIIEDTSLTELKPPSTNSNSTASSGGSSPLKTAKKAIGGDLERVNSISEGKTDDDEKSEKKNESTTTKAAGMGHFANSAHYVKIYHVLRIAYVKYKATLNYDEQPDNTVTLLGVLLKSLGQILEIATIAETSRIAEELLSYLQTVFYLEPTCVVSCVHQLLKSLFGSNLISRTDALKLLKQTAIDINDDANDGSLHYALSQYHYNDLSCYFQVLRRKCRTNRRSDTPPITWLVYAPRKEKRHAPIKSDKMLANYIRLFEPMVIRSLKDYTITSNVDVQCAVLRLLNQLVRLKVNYCLLDSEQVFVKFIQKQFEYIEEGLMAHPEKIIPKMFEFLMNLSHGKQHSKSIIGVPKVIHLCDGLMASGQAPLAYCIPALRPIVENIFLLARHHDYAIAGTAVAAADHSELEITREVLMSMLLRLFEYAQVMDLLRAILEDAKRADSRQPMEKWSKYSKQMFDVFFAKLADDKLKLDNRNDTVALMRWLIVLHPITLRLPTVGERLLTILFRKLPDKMDNLSVISRWLGKITIILTIIVQLKKDALLKAIKDSLKNFSSEDIFDRVSSVRSDPLNVTNVEKDFESIDAGAIFVKFTFRALELIAGRCALAIRQDEDIRFLIEQLSHFLFVCSRIYRPEDRSVLILTATSLIADGNSKSDGDGQFITLERINASFLVIGRSFPFVVYQWCCLLTSLDCNLARSWIRMFMVSETGNGDYGSSQDRHRRDYSRLRLNRLNSSVSTSAALISLCEYLVRKDDRLEELSTFIEADELLRLAIRHCDEPPVAEVLQSVQRHPIVSALFFERIRTMVQEHRLELNVTIRLLGVLQDCHRTQTGSLIRLLIECVLKCQHLAVLRTVVNLTCRKLEYLLTFDVADIRRQISEGDLRSLTDRLVKNKLVGKNETLLGLLSKLSVHVYEGNASEHHRQRCIDVSQVRNLEIDRTWYLKRLAESNTYVCHTNPSPNLAEVFRWINVEDVASMDDESCKKFVLRSVLALVSLRTDEDDNHQTMTDEQNSLMRLAVRATFDDLVRFLKTFPRHHQVYMPENRTLYLQEETYTQQLNAVFRNGNNATWQRDFIELTASVENITRSFRRINQLDEKSTLNLSLAVRFCVVCAESLVYRLFEDDDPNIEQIESILRRLDTMLKLPELIRILALEAHWTRLCSLVNSLCVLLEFLMPNSAYHDQSSKFDHDTGDIADAKNAIVQHCHRQFETVFLSVSKEGSSSKMPRSFRETITSILINLSKIPALNSYLLMPTALWKQNRASVMMKQDAEVDDVDRSQQPAPLPIDFLKDFQLLEEYNFRISRLGWSTRKQFEETWMSLLSVLNSGLIEENDAVPSTNSFAIRTATALLGRTLYYQPTSNNSSTLFHVSRDSPIDETDTSVKKLKSIQSKFERSLRRATANSTYNTARNIIMNVFNKPNIEKLHPNAYSCGQISIAYLSLPSKASTEGTDEDDDDTDDVLLRVYRERHTALLQSNLDLNSYIQSLLDLYSQWFHSFENRPQSAKILNEILKSIVVISDLFQHRSQFQWMLDICVEYAKNPLLENDILYQYLIVGVCKATAVLNPDMEIYELVKKILCQYAKGSNVSVRISCLHGLLYLLEGCVLSNTVIGGLSDELQLILPIAIEYIDEFQKNPSVYTNKSYNQEHDLTVWALTFFIVENIHEDHLPLGFVNSAILSFVSYLRKNKQTTMNVYSSLMKALERLIIKRCLSVDSREQILKLAIEKIKDGHAMQSLLGVQLMISSMYTDHTDRRRNSDNGDVYSDDNPDNLVHIVEKISIIFDRIKKGLPFQVEVLCHVLPDVINDFFSPADILTKVVGEYLSPQQKYPALLSHIVFEVFENGIAQSQIPLLQDWVVVSLSNFIQTFSAGMATWYLTCFFVSASTNFWLRSIFPRVRTRIGRLEYEDRLMLCIAGRDFYNNLTSDKQRQIFVDAFQRAKEEGGEPDSPFNDLLKCL